MPRKQTSLDWTRPTPQSQSNPPTQTQISGALTRLNVSLEKTCTKRRRQQTAQRAAETSKASNAIPADLRSRTGWGWKSIDENLAKQRGPIYPLCTGRWMHGKKWETFRRGSQHIAAVCATVERGSGNLGFRWMMSVEWRQNLYYRRQYSYHIIVGFLGRSGMGLCNRFRPTIIPRDVTSLIPTSINIETDVICLCQTRLTGDWNIPWPVRVGHHH